MNAIFKKEILLLFLCVLSFKASFSQTVGYAGSHDTLAFYTPIPTTDDYYSSHDDTLIYYTYIPTYDWSIGIEHSYIPAMFTQQAYCPDNLEVSFWLNQRLYGQAGIFFIQSVTDVTQTDTLLHIVGDTITKGVYFQPGFTFYVGGTLKLFLFKNAYFVPTANIYFDKYVNNPNEDWSIAIGPTAGIEYFLSDRFSLRCDFFNVNLGIGSSGKSLVLTTHRILGLGLRYSFNTKR